MQERYRSTPTSELCTLREARQATGSLDSQVGGSTQQIKLKFNEKLAGKSYIQKPLGYSLSQTEERNETLYCSCFPKELEVSRKNPAPAAVTEDGCVGISFSIAAR